MSVTDEIKSRLNIVDVIGSTVQLKKAGRLYKGLCPFHSEKTPSFVVYPDSQNWRCYGACAEGGDIFGFIMKREGWDFGEALRFLASQAGVELEPYDAGHAQKTEERDRLQSLLRDTAYYFNHILVNAPEVQHVRDYVSRRGINTQTVEAFGLGYAPNSWDSLSKWLIDLGYTAQELVDAGVVVVKDEGGTYDRFRDRLVIPIRDMRGNVVGFGARGFTGEQQPKYLNSPQSTIFDKSHLLFGLDLARRTIREGDLAVIVEGYMDVIQAHQAGFSNVVAQMGTALTEEQLKLLSRYTSRLILALDPDAAGQMATERGREVIEKVSKAAAEQARQEGAWGFDSAERDHRATLTAEFDARGMIHYEGRLGFDIRVVVLPAGKDPDDLIREDPAAWALLIEQAMPIVEYAIQGAIAGKNLDDPKVKANVAKAIVPLINDVANPVERSHYHQRLARLLKVDERALFPEGAATPGTSRTSKRDSGKPSPRKDPAPVQVADLKMNPTLRLEAFCLAALIQHSRLIYRINRTLAECVPSFDELAGFTSLAGEITPNDFAHPEHRAIFEAWQQALDQEELAPIPFLKEVLEPITLQRLNTWLNQPLDALRQEVIPDKNLSPDKIYDAAIMALLDLRRQRLDDQLKQLQFLIGDMGPDEAS
jgi:DNA primase